MTNYLPGSEESRREAMVKSVAKHVGEHEIPFIGWVLLFIWLFLVFWETFKDRTPPPK